MSDKAEFEIVIKDDATDQLKAAVASLNALKEALTANEQALSKAKAAHIALADAGKQLQSSLDAEKAKLNELSAAKDKLNSANEVDIASYKKLEKAIMSSQKNIGAIENKMINNKNALAKSQEKISKAEDKVAGSKNKIKDKFDAIKKSMEDSGKGGGGALSRLFGALQKVGGPLGKLGQAGEGLLDKFGSSGGLKNMLAIGMVGALVAVAIACAAAAAALIKFAISSAVAARNQMISLRAVTGHAVAAKDLVTAIKEISKNSALTNEQLQEYATNLFKARVYGKNLQSSLEAISTASTVMGDSAGKAIQGLITEAVKMKKFTFTPDNLLETGLDMIDISKALAKNLNISFAQAKAAIQSGSVSVTQGVDAINTAVSDKFGALSKEKLLDPEVLFKNFKQNAASLFEDMNIEPLLGALRELLSVFDSNTVAGAAFKALLTTILTPLFEGIGAITPYIQKFFLLMIIYTFKTLTALVPLYNWFKKLSNSLDTSGFIEFEDVAKVVFGIIAGLVGGVVIALAAIYVPIYIAIKAFAILYKIGAAVFGYLGSISLVQVGVDMVKGLANGIKNAAVWVIEAIVSLAGSAIEALKKLLKIASPSKVFEQLGMFTGEGLSIGIEKSTSDVEASTQKLMEPTLANIPAGQAGATTNNNNTSTQSKVIRIENINYSGSMDSFDDFKTKMRNFLREEALQMGVSIEVPA